MKKITIIKETPGKISYVFNLVDGRLYLTLRKIKHINIINAIKRRIYISPEMTINELGKSLLEYSGLQHYGQRGVYTGIDFLISIGGRKL